MEYPSAEIAIDVSVFTALEESEPGVAAAPSDPNAGPIVQLTYGSFQGSIVGNVAEFLGIPFAAPPVGNLRFAPPQAPLSFKGVRPATSFGAACFQQSTTLPSILGGAGTTATGISVVSEDCLFINVVKPANVPAGQKLPVLMWIYGGGFEDGDTSTNPGDTVVARSIALNEPVIYVSANYRVSALGFLGGSEVKAAGIGNAGLRDQRFAMEWIQRNIAAFGGDSQKVTIWGESAGAISVGLHLVVNNGNPTGLFHGAFMESGSPIPLTDITTLQPSFDQLVANTNCTGSSNLIQCLRAVPFDALSTAMNQSPNIFSFMSLELAWQPTVDGQFLVRDPQVSIQRGLYAKIPLVTGDCDDEGTLFSLSTTNITTDTEFLGYMQSNYFQNVLTPAQLTAVGQAYPADVTQGSPFDTGAANALTPEFKRLAAIQGDLVFQAPRRFFLGTASKTQPTFAFLFKRGKATPLLGAFHGSDIPEFYGTGAAPDFIGTDALVNFANNGNPNRPLNTISLLSAVDWKSWGSSAANPPILTFLDPAPTIAITTDTFRVNAMQMLTNISLQLDSKV
ncbi:carotenoid ester lipase precursor [Crassisporium funariophilum]|nr:carotenoid ester lipase precursor [Crassisporium funariophilum]